MVNSEEHKRKISEALKGRKRPEISEKMKGNKRCVGRILSDETKRKIGEANNGRKRPDLTEFNKGRKRMLGKKHSDETKEKIAAAHRGKKRPQHVLDILKYYSKQNIGRKHTPAALANMLRGENHPNWKGGLSFEPYSPKWTRSLKKLIRERDNHVCVICGENGHVVHHMDYDKKNCNPDNLITLCESCHSKTNYNREQWILYFINRKENHYDSRQNIGDYSRSARTSTMRIYSTGDLLRASR